MELISIVTEYEERERQRVREEKERQSEKWKRRGKDTVRGDGE